jgi:hypothetical protein
MTENAQTTPDPDVAAELDEEPYNPATGHIETPHTRAVEDRS